MALGSLSAVDGLVRLSEVVRSGRVESIHFGAAVVSDASGSILASAGPPSLGTYLRSAAKPVQLLTMLEVGLQRHLRLTDEELAVAAASHGGETGHVATVRALLNRAGLGEDLLRCGASAPLDGIAHEALLRAGESVSSIHNNCSGKHAAMLITCKANDWPLDSYLEPDHPLQLRIAAKVSEFAGEAAAVGVDGCGVPTFYLPLVGGARAVATLMERAEDGGEAGRVVVAMTTRPWFTSGTHRLAFRLMSLVPGLLAKEGAEGYFVVGIPRNRSPWGRAVGLAVKVIDGGGEGVRGREPAVASALLSLGVARPGEEHGLKELSRAAVVNAAGREVGEIRGLLGMDSLLGASG